MRRGSEDAPFDVWLRRQLREEFGGTALEPLPDELARLVLSVPERPAGL